jgi:uncharacterized membrane protein affecting hemolysin expression
MMHTSDQYAAAAIIMMLMIVLFVFVGVILTDLYEEGVVPDDRNTDQPGDNSSTSNSNVDNILNESNKVDT